MDIKQLLWGSFSVAAFYGIERLFTRKRRYLLKNGIPAEAIVVSIKKTNIRYGSEVFARPLMEIVLQIENKEGVSRNITIRQDFELREMPEQGSKVDVLIDPGNPEYVRIVIKYNGRNYIS